MSQAAAMVEAESGDLYTKNMWDVMMALCESGQIRVPHIDKGDTMEFKLVPEYEGMFRSAFDKGFRRHIVIKARRMYMTTHILVALLILIARCPGFNIAFINWTVKMGKMNAKQIIDTIITESPFFKRLGFTKTRLGENEVIQVKHGNLTSNLIVTSNMRSGSGGAAHFTDFAAMTKFHPKDAEESFAGTLNAMPNGWIFVESTAAGRTGRFAQEVQECLKRKEDGMPDIHGHFKLHFYPWYEKARNWRSLADKPKDWKSHEEFVEYRNKREFQNLPISEEQWWWYEMAWMSPPSSRSWKVHMEEHPTTIEEAFRGDTSELLLMHEIDRAEADGRIYRLHPTREPVKVAFDLGGTAISSVLFHHKTPSGIYHILDYLEFKKVTTMETMMSDIARRGWNISGIQLPHDGTRRSADDNEKDYIYRLVQQKRVSVKEFLFSRGWGNAEVAPRVVQKTDGFAAAQSFAANCHFDEDRCKLLLDRLRDARVKDLRAPKLEINPDENAHGFDAFQTAALCHELENLTDEKPSTEHSNQAAAGIIAASGGGAYHTQFGF